MKSRFGYDEYAAAENARTTTEVVVIPADCPRRRGDRQECSCRGRQPSRPTPRPAHRRSDGADNFYTSDKVDRAEGHLQEPVPDERRRQSVHAQDAGPGRASSGDRRRPPDGRGEGAEREPVRHEDGRAGLRRPVAGPAVLGRERGPAAQRGLAGHLRRGLQRRGGLPGHAGLRRPRAHRRASASAAAAASSSARPRSTRA